MAFKFSGIYGIRSISKPERKYIGSTYNIGKRFREHKNRLKLNKHENKKLQRHVNKYGIDDLIFDILIKRELEQSDSLFYIKRCEV